MFTRAVRLFDIFGFQIKVDPSWLLIAALLVWTLSGGYFPDRVPGLSYGDYLGLAVIAMLAFFGGLILHELAHSLVARRFGLGIGGITLFIFGGVAELDEEPASPVSEFWIAIAGPTMSLALAALAWLVHLALEGADVSAPMQVVFEYLAIINLILAVFNMLPAFPLDGGRVLRAALWRTSGDLVRATRNASAISQLVAYALIALGLVSLFSGNTAGGLWQILIGLFLMSAARGTYQQLLIKSALGNRTVAKMMTENVQLSSPDDTLSGVVNDIMLAHAVSFVPVTEGEHLLGYVDSSLVRRIDRENWDNTHVGDIFIASDTENTLPPDFPADALLQRIAKTGRRKYLVAEKQRFVGVITLTDLLSYLAVLQEIGPGRAAASLKA
ncbi:site-2 protease family protein [Defluviimonas sp. SAOS-178_SWC]|uniref:site-2 protease family protein n=1 Tax=Defluviimonas sp. SAOS-178_SWC TaxID=3121287 RepID=UPI003221E0A3